MPTLLCVPIMVQDEPTAARDAAAAADAGADMVEFRIDEFFTGSRDAASGELDQREVNAILRLVAGSPLPCIVTCRAAAEAGGAGGAGAGGSGGGGYDGDEMARVSLYERLGTASTASSLSDAVRTGDGGAGGTLKEHPPRYLDFEFESYRRSANIRQKIDLAVQHSGRAGGKTGGRDVTTGLILSTHDFTGRPPDLLRRLTAMQLEPAASLIKIAYAARSVRDNLELFDILAENAAGRPTIALAMGRFGLMSRVLAPKFGGFLTFASLRPAAATAPGQPTVSELLETYRFRSIGKRTRVFGLIGWPVEHSLSPLVHNAGFEAYTADDWDVGIEIGEADQPSTQVQSTGLTGYSVSVDDRGGQARAHAVPDPCDAVYLPLPVPPEYEHFKATLSALIDHPRLDFGGCSVTVPHKQHLVRFARGRMAAGEKWWSIDELSALCGAANTLVIERDAHGQFTTARVVNTDGPAAVAALAAAIGGGGRGNVANKRIVILGAGGAARAIAAELLRARANVMIANRTRSNAESFASELTAALAVTGRIGTTAVGTISAADLADFDQQPWDALINCTSVGMKDGPAPDQSPVDPLKLAVAANVERGKGARRPVVFDTVYNPLQTKLLQDAASAGLRTIDGLAMFVRQAGAQFTLWTGKTTPSGLFERICREELSLSS